MVFGYRCALLILLLAFVAPVAAERLPLWEAGIGVAPVSFPHYRGSSEQEVYLLPLPYLIYRGDAFQIDRGGARGLLVDTPRFTVDVSADGAVPVASGDEGARAGMADLDPVFEIGPSAKWLLHRRNDVEWQLRMPVRAGVATDFRSAKHIGWKAHPMLAVDIRNGPGGWNLGMSAGPQFASRDYHGYYYDVARADAAATRPAYRASAGYSGTALQFSASRRFRDWWVGAFLRYEYLGGAAFEGSPLVETRQAVTGGLGVAWVFGRSERTVDGAHPHPAHASHTDGSALTR